MIDILIITILPDELDALRRVFGLGDPTQHDGLPSYYECHVVSDSQARHKYHIAVSKLTKAGNVEAASHSSLLVSALKPKNVLVVGIAAGTREDVSLGDVIVSTEVWYYEPGKETPDGCEVRPAGFRSDASLLSAAQNLAPEKWLPYIQVPRPDQSLENPKRIDGPVAVGEKVVADQAFINSLQNRISKLVGIEMESYGVGEAAAKCSPPPRFLSVRGVSDRGNENKNDDWHRYASASAAAFAYGLIKSGILPARGFSDVKSVWLENNNRSVVVICQLSMEAIPERTMADAIASAYGDRQFSEIKVDQTDLFENGQLMNPREAAKRQIDLAERIDNQLNLDPTSEIAYLGLAHIPLLFYAGYQITNKRSLRFFEFNEHAGSWESLSDEPVNLELSLEGLPQTSSEAEGDVVLRISVSSSVSASIVSTIIPNPLVSLHLSVPAPKRKLVVSQQQLNQYGKVFARTLDTIRIRFPNASCIHIFYAGPVSLAVYLGQFISHTMDPKVIIYNYSRRQKNQYSWGLAITEDIDSGGFFVQLPQGK